VGFPRQKFRPRRAVEIVETNAKRNALPQAGVAVTTQPSLLRFYALHAGTKLEFVLDWFA
jgi:hypothetical protein